MNTPVPVPSLDAVRTGGKPVMARALAALETHQDHPDLAALLDAAWEAPRAHVVGITGPPGVGKSSLINAMIRTWRERGLSVGVLAIDPSSRRSGGALLGDRTRITADPEDQGVFIRSMAARERLGGLSDLTFAAMVLMRTVYDRVLVETVGVGQSETEIADLADSVIFCVQPASGDSLQFMKAGIMEVPHIAVVTKADMGEAAERARADLKSALGLVAEDHVWAIKTVLVSVREGTGIAELADAVEEHARFLDGQGLRSRQRAHQAGLFIRRSIRDRFGIEGVQRAEPHLLGLERGQPFRAVQTVARTLLSWWQMPSS